MKVFGEKSLFAIEIDELTLNLDMCNVNIYIKNVNLCCDDNSAYLPSFIRSMKSTISRLNINHKYQNFEHYFEGKSAKEIHAFLCRTRSPRSRFYGIENDKLYPSYSIFDWGETTDNVICFCFPRRDSHYLTFQFWRKTHFNKGDIGLVNYVQTQINDVRQIIHDSSEYLGGIYNRNKKI